MNGWITGVAFVGLLALAGDSARAQVNRPGPQPPGQRRPQPGMRDPAADNPRPDGEMQRRPAPPDDPGFGPGRGGPGDPPPGAMDDRAPGGPGRPAPANRPSLGPDLLILWALDTNSDGEISASEIANAAAALKRLDKNGDGRISREELRLPLPGGDPQRRDGGFGLGGDRGPRQGPWSEQGPGPGDDRGNRPPPPPGE